MDKKALQLQFHFLTPASLKDIRKIRALIFTILKRESRSFDGIDFVFCDDEYLLTLNQKFLQHDFYTDILSFELSGPSEPLTGEIYISIQRVKENAKTLGLPFYKELHRVIIHGVLHFCGYKDKSAPQAKRMRQREDHYLKLYFGKGN